MSSAAIQHLTWGDSSFWADCVGDTFGLTCASDKTGAPYSILHLVKIVSNTHPSAAHAAPRTSQRTCMPNRCPLSLSFMNPCL